MTAPTPGRANSRTPNTNDTSPDSSNSARMPALSPAWKPAKNSAAPPTSAHDATTMTSTYAVGAGQTRANSPAASPTSASSRWPRTGPADRLLNARMVWRPASANA